MLALLLALTLLGAIATDASVRASTDTRLRGELATLLATLDAELRTPPATAHAGHGLFAASRSVERDEFHAFYDALPAATRASMDAFLFARIVPAADVAAFEEAVRADTTVEPRGYPDFRVSAGADRDPVVVDFAEPAGATALMGWDVSTAGAIDEALGKARDSAAVVASAPTPHPTEPLAPHIYFVAAVYRNDAPTDTVEERRAAVVGFVVTVVEPGEALPVLRRLPAGGLVHIADAGAIGATTAPPTADVLSTAPHAPEDHDRTRGAVDGELDVAGRRWRVSWIPGAGTTSAFAPYVAPSVFGFGAVISVLGTGVVYGFLDARSRARALARRMTRELAESESLARALASATSEAVLVVDAGRILEANSTAARLFGADVFGRPLLTLFAADDALRLAPSGELPTVFEARMSTARGLRLFEGRARAVTRGGRSASAVSMRDVTEERELAEMRAHAQAVAESAAKAAQEASLAKSAFLTNMSHEIRTPMNAIIGMATLLGERPLDAEARHQLDVIRASGDHLLALINDLLDLARVESGRLVLETGPVDILETVEAALELLAVRAAEKGLELTCWLEPDVPAIVEGDARRLRQVLLNLLGNALKFTERGGVHVRVAARSLGDGRAELTFAVEDTGPGIPEEALARLFTPFQQADATISRQHGGSGLGLAISRQLVRSMGGDVTAESQVGVGSTFVARLPATVLAARAPRADLRAPPGRLVVASPSARARQSVRAAAEEVGWRVEEADALHAAVLAAAPDVVIADERLDPAASASLLRAHAPASRLVVLGRPGPRAAAWSAHLAGEVPLLSTPARRASVANILAGGAPHRAQAPTGPSARAVFDAGLARRAPHAILVVDDNAVNVEVTVSYLRRLGYAPATASDGAQAIERARELRPDLIFMDIQMPVMDGVTAAARILQGPYEGTPPRIVALTAHALAAERERCLAVGMSGYLTKPVDIPQLVALLEGDGATAGTPPPARVAALDEMREALGEEATARLVRTYLDDLDPGLDRLARATDAGDMASATREAHKLAGTSLTFGMEPLGLAARAFENEATAEGPPARAARVGQLRRLRDDAVASLRAYA